MTTFVFFADVARGRGARKNAVLQTEKERGKKAVLQLLRRATRCCGIGGCCREAQRGEGEEEQEEAVQEEAV